MKCVFVGKPSGSRYGLINFGKVSKNHPEADEQQGTATEGDAEDDCDS